MKKFPFALILACALTFISLISAIHPAADPIKSNLTPTALRCEYLENPLAIETAAPRLSWMVTSEANDQRQVAYQIAVYPSLQNLNDDKDALWGSGRIASSQTVNIEYTGKPLASRQTCFWKVRVWDQDNNVSAWSEPAQWTMGLLDKSDWKAEWISFKDDAPIAASQKNMEFRPARYYRKTFTAEKSIRRAMAFATALGIYKLQVNGQPASEQRFTPGWSDYHKRVYYNTFDVTNLLKSGENALSAIVADGWYSGYLGYGLLVGYGPNHCGRYIYGKTPSVLIQLEIDYEDGSRETIETNSTWKVSTGPITQADMLMGETYDARLEQKGWSAPGFDDSAWSNAIRAEENGSVKMPFFDQSGEREAELGFQKPAKMQSYPSVPIRPTGELHPTAITEPEKGVYIFNLGQNFSGVVRLKVKGEKGTKIRIRHGEMLHPDGRLMTENLRKAQATDTYILRGDGEFETWTPRFTYHGFQYVELTGLMEKPTLDTVTGIVLHSDTPLASSFECSDPMVNQLFKNIVWTQRSNFFEIPTDCPQRDERFGWTGDAQIYIRTASYNADVAAFYTKWLDDLEEAQLPNGAYPDYAPYPMMHGKPNRGFATAWMDAGIICPYTIYKVYGDRRAIERHYDSMKRFMDFRKKNSPDFLGVDICNGWGDWLSIGSTTPIEYIDTVYFAYSAHLMAEMAAAIGRNDDAREFGALYEKIKEAFVKKYSAEDGKLSIDNQTTYAIALLAGLIPQESREQTAKRLAELIQENDYRMSTGFLGTRPLLPVLTETGHIDLAARLLQSRRFPSWGYEIENGATSIWERWNSYTKDKGFFDVGMNSFSHYSFGAVCEWMFRDLAGIDTEDAGFDVIVIDPNPPAPGSNPEHEAISWVKAEYDSIHGKIKSQWKREADRFMLEIETPANTTAKVYIPAASREKVRVNDRPLTQLKYNELSEQREGRVIVQIGSGKYRFVSELK